MSAGHRRCTRCEGTGIIAGVYECPECEGFGTVPTSPAEAADLPDHWHCPAVGCYWRIQFMPVCSRCGGATVRQPNCCGVNR